MTNDIKMGNDERILLQLGAQRYQRKLAALQKNKLSALTDYGANILSSNLPKVTSRLSSNGILPADITAYIGLSTVLNYLDHDTKFASLARKIGNTLQHELNAQQLKLDPSLSKRQIISKLREHTPTKLSSSDILREGAKVLNAIGEATNIFEFSFIYQNNKKYRVVSPSKEFEQHYEGYLRNNINRDPLSLPITSFPIPVNEELIGGYAFDVLEGNSSLQYRTKEQLTSMSSSQDISRIQGVINSTQSIPYSIDKNVYQIASQLFSEGANMAGIPGEIPDLPNYEDDKKLYFNAKTRANSLKGKRYNKARTLGIASEMLAHDHFYFPCYLDFRGRLYYRGDYLNPQGNDLSKALLQFTSKAKIEEDFFYFVHGANCYGIKGSYMDRYKWVTANKDQIRTIAKDPIENLTLWQDADSPFSYLAFVLDCNAYLNDPENYESGLRIASDASSSGLQILSLLLRDEEGCIRTNVIGDGNTAPKDVYIECLQVLRALLETDANSNLTPVRDYAKFWLKELKGKNSRNLVKRILMTSVYSLSQHGLSLYVQEWINENRLPNRDDYSGPDKYLKKRVAEAVKDTVKGASLGMEWIKAATKQLINLNKDLEQMVKHFLE